MIRYGGANGKGDCFYIFFYIRRCHDAIVTPVIHLYVNVVVGNGVL